MRLVIGVMTILLLVGVLGFVLTNLDAKVDATVWKTTHHDVPVYLVVILSVLAGIVYVGVIAVAEGASIRLANRRLGREVARLESELTYYRTQPTGTRVEPDAIAEVGGANAGTAATESGERSIPTAPVYGADGEWGTDPGDDAYSGGRAV